MNIATLLICVKCRNLYYVGNFSYRNKTTVNTTYLNKCTSQIDHITFSIFRYDRYKIYNIYLVVVLNT